MEANQVAKSTLMASVELLAKRPEGLRQVVEKVRSASKEDPLAVALEAVLPLPTSSVESDKGSRRFAKSLGQIAAAIQEHAAAVPGMMEAFLRVNKLEPMGVAKAIPEHLVVSEAALPPLPPDMQERPVLEREMLEEYELRRRALQGEEVQSNVFALFGGNGRLAHECLYRTLTPEEDALPKFVRSGALAKGLVHSHRVPGGECLIHSFYSFQQNIRHFEQGLLWGLDLGPDRLVVGGSATMACVLPVLPSGMVPALAKLVGRVLASHICDFIAEVPPWLDAESGAFANSDLDLFIIAEDMEEAERRFIEAGERVYRNVCGASRVLAADADDAGGKDVNHVFMARTGHTVTICGRYPLRHVQLVAYVAKSITEVLAFTDLDCTAMVYDGSNVWASNRSLRAHSTGYNVSPRSFLLYTDPAGCCHLPTRVHKYATRGFGTLFSGCCLHSPPRCTTGVSDEFRAMLQAMETAQQAPPDLWAFMKKAVTYRLACHVASERRQAKLRTGQTPATGGFYDTSVLFPGIPRGPSHDPYSLHTFLGRNAPGGSSAATSNAQLADLIKDQPQPLKDFNALRECTRRDLAWRIVKSRVGLLNPLECF